MSAGEPLGQTKCTDSLPPGCQARFSGGKRRQIKHQELRAQEGDPQRGGHARRNVCVGVRRAADSGLITSKLHICHRSLGGHSSEICFWTVPALKGRVDEVTGVNGD